ncbi:MAG: hypothetical protein ACREUF_14955 [Solimonas sp.]
MLALHCSEVDMQGSFVELLDAIAPGERVERIALPGSAWWLAQAAELTEGRIKRIVLGGRQPVRDVVDAILSSSALRQVVLLGHQECAWYRQQFPRLSPGDLVREQGNDLIRAREEVWRWSERNFAINGWIVVAAGEGVGGSAKQLF